MVQGRVRFLGQQRLPGVEEAGCFSTTLTHMGVWRKALRLCSFNYEVCWGKGVKDVWAAWFAHSFKKMRGEVFFLLTKTFLGVLRTGF